MRISGSPVQERIRKSARETIIFANTFDLIVAPESFMIHVAGALNIPNVAFFSHSAPDNVTKYFENSIPIVPECECSPCYLIQKDFRQTLELKERKQAREQEQYCLLRERKDHFRGVGYRCCVQINHQEVIRKISELIEAKNE